MKQRIPYIRLLAFVLVGLLAAGLVAVQTLGRDAFSGDYHVTMRLPDTGGIVESSQVTYRGKPVGTVRSVTIDPGGTGVTLTLSIKAGYRIPKNTRAAISMDVPIAIEHVDLRPRTNSGPYLRDGDTIPARDTTRPIPFNRFLARGAKLLESIDANDLATVGDELSTALSGMDPQLRTLLTNSKELMTTADDLTPQLLTLSRRGTATLDANRDLIARLPELATRIRAMTSDMSGLVPQGESMMDTGPSLIRKMLPLLDRNERSVAVMIANMAGFMRVLSTRTPALAGSMTDGPAGVNDFASVFFPSPSDPTVTDANTKLVATTGPVCYYGTKRRTPQQTGARDIQYGWTCPGTQQYLQQRGSVNAPTPANTRVGTYNPDSGLATGPDGSTMQLEPNNPAARGPQHWSALLSRGVR